MATEQEITDWFERIEVGDTFIWKKNETTTITCVCIPINPNEYYPISWKAFDFGHGNNRYYTAGLANMLSYKHNIILDPTFHAKKELDSTLTVVQRRTRELERRFKAKIHPKTKMKALPFPKGVPTCHPST